jgi:hypothetical protein
LNRRTFSIAMTAWSRRLLHQRDIWSSVGTRRCETENTRLIAPIVLRARHRRTEGSSEEPTADAFEDAALMSRIQSSIAETSGMWSTRFPDIPDLRCLNGPTASEAIDLASMDPRSITA